jgi:hypothetical protein
MNLSTVWGHSTVCHLPLPVRMCRCRSLLTSLSRLTRTTATTSALRRITQRFVPGGGGSVTVNELPPDQAR